MSKRLTVHLRPAQESDTADMLLILEQAGFERAWEHALFVYSKS